MLHFFRAERAAGIIMVVAFITDFIDDLLLRLLLRERRKL